MIPIPALPVFCDECAEKFFGCTGPKSVGSSKKYRNGYDRIFGSPSEN